MSADRNRYLVLAELKRVEAAGEEYPTTRELATRTRVSLSSIHAACAELAEAGKITNHRGWGMPRRPVAVSADGLRDPELER